MARLPPVPSPGTPLTDLHGVRVGFDPAYAFYEVDPPTRRVLDRALETFEGLGADVAEVVFPDPSQAIEDWFGVCAVQTAVAHSSTFPERRDEYGPALAELLDLGNRLRGVDYQELLLRRAEFSGRVAATLGRVDVFLTPVLGLVTPTIDRMTRMDESLITAVHRFTCPFPMSGHPTITLPGGWSPEGLPIGIQLVGAQWSEAMLVDVARVYQLATDWHRAEPALPLNSSGGERAYVRDNLGAATKE